MPYLVYGLGPSIRHRPDHVTKDGVCAPIDAPFWDEWFPPNGWQCKCHVRQISKEEASNYSETIPKISHKNWINRRTGEVVKVPVGIDPGFAHNPGKARMAWLESHPQMQKLKEVYKDKLISAALIPPVFSTNEHINAQSLQSALYKIPQANKQADKVLNFVHKNNIQTIIVSEAEMNPNISASKNLLDDILKYLPTKQRKWGLENFAIKEYERAGGFTHPDYNHLVLRVEKNIDLKDARVDFLQIRVKQAIRAYHKGEDERFATIVGINHVPTRTVGIYIHELGHQLRYKAGMPKIPNGAKHLTLYSEENVDEWFSESFSAWLLNYDEYVKFDPKAVKFFNDFLGGE